MMTTVLVTDERFDDHSMPGHPECAERLQVVRRRFSEEGVVDKAILVEPQPADIEAIRAVHAADYLTRLEESSHFHSIHMLGLDTYITPASYRLACLAAGATIEAADRVMTGRATNAVAAIRPPGHHATPTQGMGFCLINNVAVAARHLQRRHGVERIAIVDIDVHHGNGTQDVFYADPTVLYISTHQVPLYPGTGAMVETGDGPGAGYTINIPLRPGTGDRGYAQVLDAVIWPALERFEPQILFVSTGFDAHWRDPLANMALTLKGYDRLVRGLMRMAERVCNGRIVFVMEGGYDLEVLGCGWLNIVRALLGEREIDDPIGPMGGVEADVSAIINRLIHIHKIG